MELCQPKLNNFIYTVQILIYTIVRPYKIILFKLFMYIHGCNVLIASIDSADFANYVGFLFLLHISMDVLLKPVHSQ